MPDERRQNPRLRQWRLGGRRATLRRRTDRPPPTPPPSPPSATTTASNTSSANKSARSAAPATSCWASPPPAIPATSSKRLKPPTNATCASSPSPAATAGKSPPCSKTTTSCSTSPAHRPHPGKPHRTGARPVRLHRHRTHGRYVRPSETRPAAENRPFKPKHPHPQQRPSENGAENHFRRPFPVPL